MVELSPGGSVALGVFVGLLSTSIQSVGLTLQRKSHLLEDEKEEDHMRRPPYRRRRWQLGMLMFIVSNIVGSTIQITTLPLPVLSTLQASGLVFNSICATLILSEPFTRYSLFGTILVAAGAVLIGTFGALTEPSHNLDQLLSLLGRTEFLIWLIATFLISILLFLAQWLLKRLARPSARIRLLRGMCFAGISGILSAHSLLVAKSAVELLVRTIVDRHNQFNRWQSWIILLGLVALALTQLYYLHRGLKLASTSVLYPFVFCIYNIIAILDGLIYFRQTSRLPVRDAALIAVGTAILLAGVAALSWRLDDQDPATRPPSAKRSHRRSISGIVPTPHSALTPGLGFLDTGADLGSDDEDNQYPTRFDEEAPLGISSSRKKRTGSHAAGADPDENTPLLRTATAPSADLMTRSQPSSPHPDHHGRNRPNTIRRARRKTISEEAGEIWDELNDRHEPRHRSAGAGRGTWRSRGGRSNSGTPFGFGSRSGTLPARRHGGNNTWGVVQSHRRVRSWFGNISGPNALFGGGGDADAGRRDAGYDHPAVSDGDDTDGEGAGVRDGEGSVASPEQRGRRWSLPAPPKRRGDNSGGGGWFKMRWWR
ncbi:hypothetical protein K490DRAFT_17714, partial [Saccharata proteae CBS 121410]